MSAPFSNSTVICSHPYMVQMFFKTVTQSKNCIALNHLPENGPDHIMFNVVAATQTNANLFILYVLSIAHSQSHKISTRHVTE